MKKQKQNTKKSKSKKKSLTKHKKQNKKVKRSLRFNWENEFTKGLKKRIALPNIPYKINSEGVVCSNRVTTAEATINKEFPHIDFDKAPLPYQADDLLDEIKLEKVRYILFTTISGKEYERQVPQDSFIQGGILVNLIEKLIQMKGEENALRYKETGK